MSEKKVKETEKKENTAKSETVNMAFPVDSKISNYGFIFMRKSWLAALDWKKGMPLKIERNPDGSITVRKA